ncbi:MAG: YfcE family phosphodiesterase [bacterium]
MKIIGVIADTHFTKCNKLAPDIINFFSDVSMILHAGDIGDKSEFKKLENIAPVVAVMGNKQSDREKYNLRDVEHLTIGPLKIMLVHKTSRKAIQYAEYLISKAFKLKSIALHMQLTRLKDQLHNKVNVCVFGHFHEVVIKKYGNLLILNPGAAYSTRKRVGSVMKLSIDDNGKIEVLVKYLANQL